MDYKDIVDYKTELKYFLENYALGLVGSPQKSVDKKDNRDIQSKDVIYVAEEAAFYVPIPNEKNAFFLINAINDSNETNLSILRYLYSSFNKINKYYYDEDVIKTKKTRFKIDYPSKYSHINQLEYATQMAISRWIARNGDSYIYNGINGLEAISNRVESLLKLLDNWSKKTYEGRSVSFSFVIDPTIEPLEDDTFLEFLDEEYSATLTDCITSAFEIDLKCSLRNYLSIVENTNRINGYKLRNGLPIRFSNIINKLIIGNKIGVFLLSNGDIIVAQHGKIIFVKRCGKWLNFSKDIFEFAIRKYCNKKKLIHEMFSTIMDISFSHSGGIIAFLKSDKLYKNDDGSIDSYDLLDSKKQSEDLQNYLIAKGVSESVAKREVKKRDAKRIIIKKILNIQNDELVRFIDVERKLRSDLAALDGALILNKNGYIIAAGTIIKADKGSSGGGRSTAAKTLSNDGLAIKVSTDGYIEVYVNSNLIYAIK